MIFNAKKFINLFPIGWTNIWQSSLYQLTRSTQTHCVRYKCFCLSLHLLSFPAHEEGVTKVTVPKFHIKINSPGSIHESTKSVTCTSSFFSPFFPRTHTLHKERKQTAHINSYETNWAVPTKPKLVHTRVMSTCQHQVCRQLAIYSNKEKILLQISQPKLHKSH